MIFDNLPEHYIQPDRFRAIIEIPKEQDQVRWNAAGPCGWTRILYTLTLSRQLQGLIRMLSEDGDHLNVLVLCAEPLVPFARWMSIPSAC